MDDWSKKLLEQHGAVAIALKEIEQRNRFSQTVTDSVLKASLAAEYQRAMMLNTVQDQFSLLHTESKNWAVYSDQQIEWFSTASEFLNAQEASQRHLAMYIIHSKGRIKRPYKNGTAGTIYTQPLIRIEHPSSPSQVSCYICKR